MNQDQTAQAPSTKSYVDSYQPPTNQPPTNQPPTIDKPQQPTANEGDQANQNQSLKSQNIFFLLGVTDGTDQEKEAFLDELQQVVWEDFLENDVKLLVTAEEKTKLDQIMAQGKGVEAQEEMVVYLEKLIPDLEEIMLEKALELKADMVKERIVGMREYYAGQTNALAKIGKAEASVAQDKWRQAAETLNAI